MKQIVRLWVRAFIAPGIWLLQNLVCLSICGQTIELVGSASSINSSRIPVINDAGNVFYVNGSSYVVGNPATPVLKTLASVTALLTTSSGDTVPYLLSSNGTLTYITSSALVQSNLTQTLTVAQGNTAAAGFGNSLIKYAYDPFSKESGVFDFAVAPDDSVSFRSVVSSNGLFLNFVGVYAGPAANPALVIDSFHSPPGLPGYAVDNNGYFHACRNAQGLSLFIGRVYNNSNGDDGTGIWLHDAANGIRLAHHVSMYYGSPYPGNPAMRLISTEFGINHWPALDDEGRYAFVAKGSLPSPPYTSSSGIFAGFENNLQPVVTNGLAVPGYPGTYFYNFTGNGPIRMGTGGKMVFLASIAGNGITYGVNDRVLVVGSNPGDLKVLAHAGDQAPGMPAGAVWQQFIIDGSGVNENPASYPINDQLVMFGKNRVALVGQVTGPGITNSGSAGANDSGIWVTDDYGSLTLLARRGTPIVTSTATKTATNYFAVQGGSGRDGKPAGGNLAGQLAFANGTNTFRVTFAQAVPLEISNPAIIGNQVQFSFSTQTGKTYYVQTSSSLSPTSWSNVQTNAGDGTTKTFTFTPAGPAG